MAETGLNYNMQRDYDPLIGKYIESDPIGLRGGGYSTYAYAIDDPIAITDITGLAACGTPDCKKAADECHEECEHLLGKGGRSNQGYPYTNCYFNCMARKGCRKQIDPLPDLDSGPRRSPHSPQGPAAQPPDTTTATSLFLALLALLGLAVAP